MNIKEKLSDASIYLIPILIFGLWIVGAIHGNKKHNLDPFSSSFLVCWYYGLETMWHKTDYKELNDDIKVIVYLTLQKPNGIDAKKQLDFNETQKELKKVLKKLDSKETDYIKAGTKTFVDFMASFQNDMINSFLDYKVSKTLDLKFSDKTTKLSKICATYGLESEMNEMKMEMEKTKDSIEDDLETFDERLIDEKKMKDDAALKLNVIKSTIKEILSD